MGETSAGASILVKLLLCDRIRLRVRNEQFLILCFIALILFQNCAMNHFLSLLLNERTFRVMVLLFQ